MSVNLQHLLVNVAAILIVVAPIHISGARRRAAAPQSVLDELGRAETKWKTSKIQAYQFRFQYACNGLIPPPPPGAPPILFRVNNRISTSLRPGADPVAVPGELVQYSAVENLFAFIREAWEKRPDRLEASYDEARGYPTRVCVAPAAVVADDEYGFLITDFKVLSN
jgi:hypothetical protein